VTFIKKAHTIPKSLGGQNYNQNVCDSCNEYFGNRENKYYSIEEALKETFIISRQVLLTHEPKRKIGGFKSKFFEIKERNGKKRLAIKQTFRFDSNFQTDICRYFKRGLYKMYLEELNRQKNIGYEEKYNIIREFARYNKNNLPVFYFYRSVGIILGTKNEAETPVLFFDRMKYLYSNEFFAEIEFLGHVFGFPICNYSQFDLLNYMKTSVETKNGLFNDAKTIERLTDVDFTLSILND
jgi:hypothetical protein